MQFDNITTEAPKADASVIRLDCHFWTVRLAIIAAVTAGAIVGLIMIIVTYWPHGFSYLRVSNAFSGIMLLLIALWVHRALERLNDAFKGYVIQKPFEARPNASLNWEIRDMNGKYYLWRLYVGELIEWMYMLWNYAFFACTMSPAYLLVFNLFMLTESVFRAYNLRNWHQPINTLAKSREVTADVVLELFCMFYPLIVLWYANSTPIAEFELVRILAFPMVMMFSKMNLIWKEDIILLYDNKRIEQRLQADLDDTTTRKKRRRTSFKQREQALITMQNTFFDHRAKRAFFIVSLGFLVLYVALTFAQIAAMVRPVSASMQKLCKIEVPTCGSWFVPRDNCVHVSYLTVLEETTENTALVRQASEWNAIQIFQMSGVTNVSPMRGKWPSLKEIFLCNSNLSHFDIDTKTWPSLFRFLLYNVTKLVHIDESVLRTETLYILDIVNAPRYDVPSVRSRTLAGAEFNTVRSMATEFNSPGLRFFVALNANITKIPDGLGAPSVLIVGMNPRLKSLQNVDIRNLNQIDVRNGNISVNELERFDKAEWKYAAGNAPGCPDGWNCHPFCSKRCSDSYYATYGICQTDCLGGKCGWPNNCKKIFKDH